MSGAEQANEAKPIVEQTVRLLEDLAASDVDQQSSGYQYPRYVPDTERYGVVIEKDGVAIEAT